MKRWVAVLTVGAALSASADDWRDDLTPLKAGKFFPPRPMTAVYRFGWGAIPAAEAEFNFARPKKSLLELRLTAKTIGPVRALWQMDTQHTARCSSVTLRPIWLQQTEKYRKKMEKVRADFTPTEVVRVQETDPPGDTPPKPKRFRFPDLFDLQTALLMVRSQRLEAGDRYSLVVYPARTAYLARVDVLGRESLRVAGKTYNAIKTQLALQHITKELELEPHQKFRNAWAWLSDDDDRLLLKVEAEIFVGSVWLEIQSVKFTGG